MRDVIVRDVPAWTLAALLLVAPPATARPVPARPATAARGASAQSARPQPAEPGQAAPAASAAAPLAVPPGAAGFPALPSPCPRPARLSVPGADGASASVLFIGNSFTFAHGSAVRFYRASTVSDLNGRGIGGVPALFKAFAEQAGCEYAVSLETAPGVNVDFHLREKAPLVARDWDYVVVQGYSTLDRDHPGDPSLLIQGTKALVELLRAKNPEVDVRLMATWSRADQTYLGTGHWHGRPIEQMALDVRAGYDLAATAAAPAVRGVIPVGEAWNRAMRAGIADPNPYDGTAPGQVDLWAYDHYHASAYGCYLEALMVFGELTGLDPRSLGRDERAAFELGLSPEQAVALQAVAYEELAASRSRPPLRPFEPVSFAR
jgi:hypothetical protein